MIDPRDPFFDSWRMPFKALKKRGFNALEVSQIHALLTQLGIPKLQDGQQPAAATSSFEPTWLKIGRELIGIKEIPGVKHHSKILEFWKVIGASWIKTDEDPWCGGYVGYCLKTAGVEIPKGGLAARASSFGDWGVPVRAQVGAIGVKKRTGGNHVYFIIGETRDKRHFKVLHGNSQNMVCIGDILKADTTHIRWPAGVPQANIPLPTMAAGTISKNEQ